MKTWEELKALYIKEHLAKPLKNHQIRLNALDGIEKLLTNHFPGIIENPEGLINMDKKDLFEKLAFHKGKPLNSAEKSVLNELIRLMKQAVQETASHDPEVNEIKPDATDFAAARSYDQKLFEPKDTDRQEKLTAYTRIADAVNDVLKARGYQTGNYKVSEYLEWLTVTPKKDFFPKHWEDLCEVYMYINGAEQELDKVLQKYARDLVSRSQEADIYFFEPFQMIVEFDEDQHFNQFRGMTLKSDFYKGYPGFGVGQYAKLSSKLVKPGSKKSGFNFLKSPDPLFPEIPRSNLQDNRHRQRAFRDFLKDVISKERGIKPTVRIPAEIIMNKRKSLNDKDIGKISEYLPKLPLFKDFDKY